MSSLVWAREEQGKLSVPGVSISSATLSPEFISKHFHMLRALFFAIGLLVVIGAMWAALKA